MLEAYVGGAVSLWYDNAAKLATTATGIDVTGTVTADGLTVDGNSRINGDFTIDTAPRGFSFASSLEMGSGGSLAVFGNANTNLYSNIYFASDATHKVINTGYSAAAHQLFNGSHIFSTASAAGTAGSSIDLFTRMNIAKTGDISFYEDTGTTAKFFWDASAERLGIGTSSPSDALVVEGDVASPHRIVVSNANASGSETLSFKQGATVKSWVEFNNSTSNFDVWQYTNNPLRFGTNNTERLRIDSSGRVGIGTTSPISPLQVLGTGTLGYATSNAISSGMSAISNASAFNNIGSAKLTANFGGAVDFTGRASELVFAADNGNFGGGGGFAQGLLGAITASSVNGNASTLASNLIFYNTDGNSLTERMRIDSSGNVAIGHTSANSSRLHLRGVGSAGTPQLMITDNSSGKQSEIRQDTSGNLVFDHWTGASRSERMRIDSSGNLLVGKTAIGTATDGFEARASGYVAMSDTSAAALNVNRNTTDGALAYFYKDGTTVGSIGTRGGDVYLETGDTGIRMYDQSDAIIPVGSDGVSRDAAIDLGIGFDRFKDLYLSGNANVGGALAVNGVSSTSTITTNNVGSAVTSFKSVCTTGDQTATNLILQSGRTDVYYHMQAFVSGSTEVFRIEASGNVKNTNNSYGALSDAKIKENIVDASPKLADLMQVKVRNYNLIGETTKQIGVVAQELETVFPSMVDENADRDADGNLLETTTKGVKYSVFVPMLIKAMQEQQAIIESLTARIEALEGAN
jgi:hypothetical protein